MNTKRKTCFTVGPAQKWTSVPWLARPALTTYARGGSQTLVNRRVAWNTPIVKFLCLHLLYFQHTRPGKMRFVYIVSSSRREQVQRNAAKTSCAACTAAGNSSMHRCEDWEKVWGGSSQWAAQWQTWKIKLTLHRCRAGGSSRNRRRCTTLILLLPVLLDANRVLVCRFETIREFWIIAECLQLRLVKTWLIQGLKKHDYLKIYVGDLAAQFRGPSIFEKLRGRIEKSVNWPRSRRQGKKQQQQRHAGKEIRGIKIWQAY